MSCRLVFVASLPPISETDFSAKVKTFDSSKNAYINHLNSKKHKEGALGIQGIMKTMHGESKFGVDC
uniref:Uncharacterized protein n=1 Tax=Ditylenchus dipsaci TaxID=166011 RepID=A0A915DE04_9BILA